jgi:hypothetical protein
VIRTLAPAALALLVTLSTAWHGFVLDDASSVIGAAHTTDGVALHLLEASKNGQGIFYRPFGYLGFSIDHALYGPEPGGFHVTAIGLHVLATLAFTILAGLLVGSGPALLAGLLFAVHPVHVEAVANIWNRTEVQCALFVLLALIAHLKLTSWRRFVVVSVLTFVAVGSKETAIVLPIALLAIEWLRPEGRLTRALTPVPALVVWWGLRAHALGAEPTFGNLFEGQSLSVRFFTMGEILWHNACLLVAPLTLRADYTKPTIALLQELTLQSALGWSLTLVLAVAMVFALRKRHWTALGLGLFGATVWPFLHIIPLGLPLAERWLYLPSAGLCLLAGQALWRLTPTLKPIIRNAVVAAVIVTFSTLTVARAADWQSPLSLWEADAAKPAASAFTWANLGLSLWEAGRFEDAIGAMTRAHELAPDYVAYEAALNEMRGPPP